MSHPRAIKLIRVIGHDPKMTKYTLQNGEHYLKDLHLDDKQTEVLMADVDVLVFDLYERPDDDLDKAKWYDKNDIVRACSAIIKKIPENRPVEKIFTADYNNWQQAVESAKASDPLNNIQPSDNLSWVPKAESEDKISNTCATLEERLEKRLEKRWKIAIFKQLYNIMRDSETAWYQSFFKTNALSNITGMTDEQVEAFIGSKSQTSRTKKAWELTNRHLNVFLKSEDDVKLLTELYQHSFRNSGWFSKSSNLITTNTAKNVTFWKSSSLDAALESKSVHVNTQIILPWDSRLNKLRVALNIAKQAVKKEVIQKPAQENGRQRPAFS